MPLHRVGGVNGSITMVTGHNADWAGFEINSDQDIANDTAYGDSAASKIGNGLPEHAITVNGFLKAGVDSSAPGHSAITSVGGTATYTYDTGCTESGICIVRRLNSANARRSPVSPIRIELEVDGALTETWAVA